MRQIADLLQKGILKSHLHKIYHFDELKEAHTEMEKERTKGKIVVTI
ncbi:NADPH:quinone reductase-like Zn-dependent oxidoreductase [Pedobacter cryoconitis]|uniref:NADPH:quinone reductase-like Zn-dependent oxidoreductase n=2 Tax=Pedobacter cryoconitis TaxID=188932 RepID=A0A7X0J6I7_9SPHI|nr:NADPH:quinone reductase-like Zn-dependent oxidoreductase [Pedobacter cryoconitis]